MIDLIFGAYLIAAYLLAGLTIWAILVTDDEIKIELSPGIVILCWPLYAFAIAAGMMLTVVRYLVETLSGGK